MAWAPTGGRRSPMPPGWAKKRDRILERDGHRCRLSHRGCTGHASEVHHTRGHDDHADDALVSACAWCHGIETRKAAAIARKAAMPTMRRPPERHPGLR